MGVPGGMPGDAATLVQAVAALPAGATWSATGIGRTTLPVMLAALAAGGHLRVGMEDTVTFARGRPVTGNAELVERAAALAGWPSARRCRPADARDACSGVPDAAADNPVLAEVVRSGFTESGTAALPSPWPRMAASLLAAGRGRRAGVPPVVEQADPGRGHAAAAAWTWRASCWRWPRPATPARTSTWPASARSWPAPG